MERTPQLLTQYWDRIEWGNVVFLYNISSMYTLTRWYESRLLRNLESRQVESWSIIYETHMTSRFIQSQDSAEWLIGKVNNVKCENTNFWKFGRYLQSDAGSSPTVDDVGWGGWTFQIYRLNENVTMTWNPESEWPRKEWSMWYRSGETWE